MEAEKRKRFLCWVEEFKPDFVSRIVLSNLLDKYLNGDANSLFEKMKQLTNHELYTLCVVFKSMFDYLGINEEYKNWIKINNNE